MHVKQELIESLRTSAERLPDEDLEELRLYAEYLVAKRPTGDAQVGIHEFLEQHEEHARLMISFILQRSRLISPVNRLAQIILETKNVSDLDRSEAEEAIRMANWIPRFAGEAPIDLESNE